MASEVPPNPVTNDYNPVAWDEAMTQTDRNKALEANYLMLSPQNVPFTFLNRIYTVLSSTLDTRFATTSMINTFWDTLRAGYRVWSGLQTFSNIYLGTNNVDGSGANFDIGTNVLNNIEIGVFANRTGELHLGDGASATGAVRIGAGTSATNNVNILNGNNSTGTITLGSSTSSIRLNRSPTPNYNYPITTDKIGYIYPVTFVSDTLTTNGTNALRSVTLPNGVYFLCGSFSCSTAAGSYNISFNALTLARKGTYQFSAGQPAYPWGVSTSAIVTGAGTYTLCARNDSGGTATNVSFLAIRIA